MTKIKNRVKHLFTREVFRGENTRWEFYLYHLFVGSLFILPASIYLKMENTPTDLINFIYFILSIIALPVGLYLLSVNIIRRANKTVAPFMKYIGIPALIISNMAVYPLTSLYQLVAIILLLLPDHKKNI